MKTPEELQELLESYDNPGLECDGATRVFAWLLKKEGIPYTVMSGRLEFDGQTVVPHYWLELDDGLIVDFKARMWLSNDEDVPHGVFDPSDYPKALYVGAEDHCFIITKTIFNILTRTGNL